MAALTFRPAAVALDSTCLLALPALAVTRWLALFASVPALSSSEAAPSKTPLVDRPPSAAPGLAPSRIDDWLDLCVAAGRRDPNVNVSARTG